MTGQSYTTTTTVDQTPEEVYAAINNPRAWWSGTLERRADEVGAEFVFDSLGSHYWKFRVIELIEPTTVVWRVLEDSSTDFVQDTSEWNNTEVRFEITPAGDKTHLRFAHRGLVPEFECYEACSTGWGQYIERSLHDYITSGQGQPGAY